MYDPALEKDNCGVGMIANLRKEESHRIVKNALQVMLSSLNVVSGVEATYNLVARSWNEWLIVEDVGAR
jgi:hypothetical protein